MMRDLATSGRTAHGGTAATHPAVRGRWRRTVATFAVGLVLAGVAAPGHSGVLGRGFGGALGGATLGHLVDGQDGARTGAAIGGAVGLIRGASAAAAQKQQEEARLQAERQRAADEQRQRQAQQQTAPAGPGAPGSEIDPALVTEIQKSLVRLGFDPGDINGQMQPATGEAIRQYQAAHGLLADGQPSQELLKHMLQHGG